MNRLPLPLAEFNRALLTPRRDELEFLTPLAAGDITLAGSDSVDGQVQHTT
ncbi:hypothetical protein [Nannocystis sp. SCPEA4]|uniref:hypothetical protein n=1 Tax=Nannocystis sp. SCPEA4 TaxID=2996787 RepID=UPI00226FE490|nr:hypothetical protein [Nannocystis sp. SCPEA4]MCY1058217.1 hypothetical protein [Nannocystis sp. SCPEA4]